MDGALDLYADDGDNFDENFGQEGMRDHGADAGVDLYNDVLGGGAPSGPIKGESDHGGGDMDDSSFHGGQQTQGGSGGGRRYSLILGNLTWWTSDDDIQELIDSYGIQDLFEIRIHENRSNGQSKGFAIITVGSEETSRFLQSEIPKKDLQGQTPVCVPFSRQALNTFDAQSRKNEGNRGGGMQNNQGGNQGMGMGNRGMGNMGNRDGGGGGNNMGMGMGGMGMQNRQNDNRPRMPPLPNPANRMPGLPGFPRFPMGMGLPGVMGMRGFPPGMRPGLPGMMRPDRPMGMGGMEWDPSAALQQSAAAAFGFGGMARMPHSGLGLPTPHVNPAFFGAQAFGGMQSQDTEMGSGSMPNLVPGSDDYETLISQMKSVASNAIAKAAAECKTDPNNALEKLETALLIVSSCKVSDDDRVQRQIKSLQEAIDDIKSSKPVESRNGERHSRDRDRSRDRERDRHREERERDSRRERERVRSRSRSPKRRTPDRDRERSTRGSDRDRERDRRREGDRERDRDRDRRDSDRERERRH